MHLQSPIKIAGGKSKLTEKIVSKIPSNVLKSKDKYTYFEPFVGGGSVYLHLLESDTFSRYVINDRNKDLYALWQYLRSSKDINPLIHALEEHSKSHSDKYYYAARRIFNFNSLLKYQRTSEETIALFLYLNKTCFNGLIRYNSEGEFNSPVGKYVNPKINNEQVLRLLNLKVSASDTEVQGSDFQALVESVYATKFRTKRFFYFDPPYIPLSLTASFTSYCPENFTLYDQYRLASVLKLIDSRGDYFILSNSATKLTEEIFKGYNFEEISAARNISCKGNKRQPVKEYLITNY